MAQDVQESVSAHVGSVLGTSEARLYDQVNSSFNWVLATLFAANGGALIAILGVDKLASHPPRFALACFAVGVVASIVMGISNAAYAVKAIMPTTDLRMTLALLEAGHATFEELQQKMKALEGFGWIKAALYGSGVLSLLSMISGMIAFGCSMSH